MLGCIVGLGWVGGLVGVGTRIRVGLGISVAAVALGVGLIVGLRIFFLQLEFAVVIVVDVLEPVLGVLLDSFVVLLGLDGDYVVLFFLFFVNVPFIYELV